MNSLIKFGISTLMASTLAAGCNSDNVAELVAANDAVIHRSYPIDALNGENVNGSKVNGSKVNGSKVNGSKVNGSTLQTVANLAISASTLVGIVLETGAVLTGPDFNPTTLWAKLDDDSLAQVRVAGYQQVFQTGLAPIDSYLVIDTSTGESICGRDDSNQPIWSTPMEGIYSPVTGMPVASSGLFTFACRYAALQKCNEYGYPDWATRAENPGGAVRSLGPYHDACVRMVRADYCGDGQTHTVTGTVIDIYDNLNFNTPETSTNGSDGFYFEAEWNPDGAWCINKTRWMPTGTQSLALNKNGTNPDWQYLLDHCPERIAGNPWPGNPDHTGNPRPCGTGSSYNAAVGYSMSDQSQRSLLRNNSKLYQKTYP